MFEGLLRMERGEILLRMFYGDPFRYLWEDTHHITGEGGEQGDPLMPVSWHRSIALQHVHQGKTPVWTSAGIAPEGIDVLMVIDNTEAVVWKGDPFLPVDFRPSVLGPEE